MEMIIVILIVAGAILYFIRSLGRKAKKNGRCGGGCSCGLAGNECEIKDKERT